VSNLGVMARIECVDWADMESRDVNRDAEGAALPPPFSAQGRAAQLACSHASEIVEAQRHVCQVPCSKRRSTLSFTSHRPCGSLTSLPCCASPVGNAVNVMLTVAVAPTCHQSTIPPKRAGLPSLRPTLPSTPNLLHQSWTRHAISMHN